MKKVSKFLMVTLLFGMCSFGYAQQDDPNYKKAPKTNEKVIGTITLNTGEKGRDQTWSDQEVYMLLLEKAKKEYPDRVIDIREMKKEQNSRESSSQRWVSSGRSGFYVTDWYSYYKCNVVGKVVDLRDPEAQANSNLSQALNKALRNVREGSRIAIDMVTVSSGVSINREDLKDQLLDVLLDNGYKVVAKEYLEKLYEELQDQQSEIYNDKTTVPENNFSAVGYYINVKVTESSLRVQVVNVSTGEYEGTSTVNF